MPTHRPHALVTYRIAKCLHSPDIFAEIAIGQSLGAWEERFVAKEILEEKSAFVVEALDDSQSAEHWLCTIGFPLSLWHGDLGWLMTLAFGKISFLPGIQWYELNFSEHFLDDPELQAKIGGPLHTIQDLRNQLSIKNKIPLFMGILKPNVAMSDDVIVQLYQEAAEGGVHLLKDDEIRHDEMPQTPGEDILLKRIAAVANCAAQKNLKTLYAVHLPLRQGTFDPTFIKRMEEAGAQAILWNTWINGLSSLQSLRRSTNLPILAHPALAGAWGSDSQLAPLHPRLPLAQLIRAAGADLSLFPSPYGKIGLPHAVALDVADYCRKPWAHFLPTIPVPSAGIKPEHAPRALVDFGNDFILNAGTAIFAAQGSVRDHIKAFRQQLYGESF